MKKYIVCFLLFSIYINNYNSNNCQNINEQQPISLMATLHVALNSVEMAIEHLFDDDDNDSKGHFLTYNQTNTTDEVATDYFPILMPTLQQNSQNQQNPTDNQQPKRLTPEELEIIQNYKKDANEVRFQQLCWRFGPQLRKVLRATRETLKEKKEFDIIEEEEE